MLFQNKVKCEINDFVAIVTLDNPPVNALDTMLIDGLEECFQYLTKKDDIRAVIITGAGKSFVAGADIKEFPGWDADEAVVRGHKAHRILRLIEDLPIPTIAAINGFAFGGGLEIALVCDIRIASDKAKLGLPETTLGINPGYGGLVRLAKMINIGQAKKMIFTAEAIDAETAKSIGLVQDVVPVSELMDRVLEIAVKIGQNAPIAVRQCKSVINAARYCGLEEALALEVEATRACYLTEDKIEGVKAFVDKRKAVFYNR